MTSVQCRKLNISLCLIGQSDVGAADKHHLGPIKTQIWKANFRSTVYLENELSCNVLFMYEGFDSILHVKLM